MPSTFFGLDIAYTGVLAANASLNTTAHNIANVETKGYSRQEAVQTAGQAIRVAQTYGMVGTGAATKTITQVRNQYYDAKYWESQTNLGNFETKKYYMYQIEDYFTDKTEVRSFEPIFNGMFNALEEVYKSGGTDPNKTQFLGSAQDLCTYYAGQSDALQRLQLSVNDEIRNKVDEINTIADQLATLNKQINTIEITGNHANDLRDQRNLLIDRLSKIVTVEVHETPVYTQPGGNQKSGIYNYEVSIAGGQKLVVGYDFYTLEYKARQAGEKIHQSDADGLYEVQWSSGLEFNLYGTNLGGELKGLIEMRDGNNEEYFHGKTTDIVAGDKAGEYKVTIKIDQTKDYLTDMNKCSLPEIGRLTVLTTDYKYTSWEYDANAGTYTFTIVPDADQPDPTDPAVKAKFVGQGSQVGKRIDYMGIPYYQSQMNEWVRTFAKAMNDIELKAQDSYGNAAEVLFTSKDITDGNNTLDFSDNAANTAAKKYSSLSDDYYRLTAASFQVNANMIKDVRKFGTTYDIKQGVDAQDITEQLMSVRDDKNKAAFRGCSSKEFLQVLTADIALQTNSAVTFTDSYTNVNTAISNQRLSVSGVDNDEEALNLVRFQEAYNLSAKVMQVMTEIYDRLILETGV